MVVFLGFFAWYGGLARRGIACIGQVQLTQPVLTLLWAALLLGEHVTRAWSRPRSSCWPASWPPSARG